MRGGHGCRVSARAAGRAMARLRQLPVLSSVPSSVLSVVNVMERVFGSSHIYDLESTRPLLEEETTIVHHVRYAPRARTPAATPTARHPIPPAPRSSSPGSCLVGLISRRRMRREHRRHQRVDVWQHDARIVQEPSRDERIGKELIRDLSGDLRRGGARR